MIFFGSTLLSCNHLLIVIFACVALLTSACASLDGPTDPHDPFEAYNRSMYNFNDKFDKTIAKPVAEVYRDIVPRPVNKGITNFFSNLEDVTILINDLLQLKFLQATQDSARIVFNTTIGLFGLIDVASHMELPKHNEDFGQTLGYWGVPPGPYFVLPFFGSGTIRDTTGRGVDYLAFDPLFNQLEKESVSWNLFTLDFIDFRADLLGASKILDTAALDPYLFVREAYLQRRLNFVYDGNPPEEDFE